MSGGAPIRVRIDVLSLPAGSLAHGAAVGDALRAELARALAGNDGRHRLHELAAGGVLPVLDGGRMPLRTADRADRVGARIATRVAGGLLGTTPRSRR